MTTARSRTAFALGLALLTSFGLAGCGTGDAADAEHAQATTTGAMSDAVELNNAWVKAATEGMTAIFGELHNAGTSDVVLEGADGEFGSMFQLHETASTGTDGSSMMQEMEGGITIPPGGDHELAPGGDHIMVMELSTPLSAGDTVEIDLLFADGSELTTTAIVKDYSGAEETYVSDEDEKE